MIDDDRRLYGRPAPGAGPAPVPATPVRAPAPPPEPAPEPLRRDEPEDPATEHTVDEAPPRSRRRRWIIPSAAAVVAIAAIGVVGTTMVAAAPSGDPVLGVFDREPTAAERDAEDRVGRDGAGIGSVDELQIRRILQYADDEGGTDREIWAVRFDASGFGGPTYIVICLATEPTGMSSGPLACMEERDVARRGFIPLDQPRPSVVVDGERRVIEWGPRGDARLIDPPTPPRDGAGS